MTKHSRKTSILSILDSALARVLACGTCALLCALPSSAKPVIEPEYSFRLDPNAHPKSALVPDPDSYFYGTTEGRSYVSFGTIFRLTAVGVVKTLCEFTDSAIGADPHGALVRGTDANFYGTTAAGGAGGFGTVFKITPSGVLTRLLSFTDNGSINKGSTPQSALVQRTDGHFYGTTTYGGTFGTGTAFRVTAAGVLTTLAHFGNGKGDYPVGGLTKGSDGNLYGTTFGGGANGFGTVFKMTPAGAVTTLVSFTNNGASDKGAHPYAGLVQGADNNFYGTTQYGGASSEGTIFKVTPAGALTTLVQFTGTDGAKKGAFPQAGLIQASDGNFYGSTPSGGLSDAGTIFKMTPAGGLTTLVENDYSTGTTVYARLLQGSDGKLYGTTSDGGRSGEGTIFKMTTTGVLTTLKEFGLNAVGRSPGALVKGNDSNFYGRTSYSGPNGMGTIFRITPFGALTTLVNLSSSTGSVITDSFVKATDGRFYGIKASGLFKFTTAGTITTLGSAYLYGASPLIQATDGNFYGTSQYGGGHNGRGSCFRITPTGVATTLAEFIEDPYIDRGTTPGGLLQATDGNFYGTTQYGPTPEDYGSVFKMTPTGAVKTLVAFPSYSHSEVIQGTDGNFYGTTQYDGTNYSGTVFRVTPAGVLTTFANFDALTTGSQPIGKLVERSNGNFYGLTSSGEGASFAGTFFSLTPAGSLTALINFTAAQRDFINPSSYGSPLKLILGDDGNYYAATASGGDDGTGGVFRIRFGPTPVTKVATNIASTSATLHGTINPNGLPTTVSFQIGTAANLAGANTVPAGILAAGTTVVTVNKGVTALLHNTKYYFRIVGKNSDNTIAQNGAILSFTTKP